jgi:hypothetical protein
MGLRSNVSFLIVCGAFLCGCSTPGTLVSQQSAYHLPEMSRAPSDGDYGLFIVGENSPVITVPLKQGDRLGFDRVQGGTVGALKIDYLDAIAGPQLIPIDVAKNYQWRKL